LRGLWRLRRQLRGYDLVYDLQTSARTSRYFWLAGRPPWSGIARGCSLPHANPARGATHTLERQREQLELAGVTYFPEPDLHWLDGGPHDLPFPFALLVPGAAPHRPAKRWPAEKFAALATHLRWRGITPIVIGTAAEAPLAAVVRRRCPAARDLTGRTELADIAGLARRAVLAVGNDTGPMHLIAAVGCPSVVLFSSDSDPALTAPRGPGGAWPIILRMPDLAHLTAERVAAALPWGH
jgi:ADP-heptose:LPS heptosyltransferase